MWVVSLAVLLAGAAFSYAHLRQMDLWALKILAGSVWRLVAERFWAYDYGAAGWAAFGGRDLDGLGAGCCQPRERTRAGGHRGDPRRRP